MEENEYDLISSIMKLCKDNPELSNHAVARLSEIIRSFDPNSEITEQNAPGCAKRDIMQHIKDKEKEGIFIKLKSIMLRDIAATLAKNYDIPYNGKVVKKKCDLFKWFEENWNKIRDPFFILMDRHHEAVTK
ncbi:hypothetical protein TRFO_32937 [Tritrichomonas foetus]|uniref:Uncharacterized protein n=1 Tax=Tritrichomonas foetus TaxID=1144522 RepID=A0A1J4JMQ2_9EUKA|nr:hypothetical protein TRFO_32937 [Tritrichomonas foetus]|eukprot:OHT00399.1 hypothetical protein TRFO_32937 [Tritrichomonas foetus]